MGHQRSLHRLTAVLVGLVTLVAVCAGAPAAATATVAPSAAEQIRAVVSPWELAVSGYGRSSDQFLCSVTTSTFQQRIELSAKIIGGHSLPCGQALKLVLSTPSPDAHHYSLTRIRQDMAAQPVRIAGHAATVTVQALAFGGTGRWLLARVNGRWLLSSFDG
jgi:hypothetical protein